VATAEQRELDRRESAFRDGGASLPVRDRVVILVDDGIATGSTMLSAIEAIRRMGAARVIVAAGVAPASTTQDLALRADEVVCLLTPRDFRAVSLFYASFPQLTDDDVRGFLQLARQKSTQRAE
jgi:predicted phosphoribosyltransferase